MTKKSVSAPVAAALADTEAHSDRGANFGAPKAGPRAQWFRRKGERVGGRIAVRTRRAEAIKEFALRASSAPALYPGIPPNWKLRL